MLVQPALAAEPDPGAADAHRRDRRMASLMPGTGARGWRGRALYRSLPCVSRRTERRSDAPRHARCAGMHHPVIRAVWCQPDLVSISYRSRLDLVSISPRSRLDIGRVYRPISSRSDCGVESLADPASRLTRCRPLVSAAAALGDLIGGLRSRPHAGATSTDRWNAGASGESTEQVLRHRPLELCRAAFDVDAPLGGDL